MLIMTLKAVFGKIKHHKKSAQKTVAGFLG